MVSALLASGKEFVRAAGEPIEHLRAAELLRMAPGIEQPALLQVDAEVLHPHVAHAEPPGEIAHRRGRPGCASAR